MNQWERIKHNTKAIRKSKKSTAADNNNIEKSQS
jgi:hypothetical protein